MGGTQSRETANEVTYKKPRLAALEVALGPQTYPIEINDITIDAKQLQQIISTTIAISNISEPLLETINYLKGQNHYLDSILELNLNQNGNGGGPLKIETQVTKILTDLVNKEGDLSQFDAICESLSAILLALAPIFGDWIGIFLGEKDVNEVITELIEMGAHESFDLIQSFYYSLPAEIQNMLNSRENIEKFLNQSLIKSRQIIKQLGGISEVETEGITTQAVETVHSYLGHILLAKVIEEQFRPAIKPATKVLEKVLPLTFSVLAINQFCTQKEKLGALGPISVTPVE